MPGGGDGFARARLAVGLGVVAALTVASVYLGDGEPWTALVPCLVFFPLYLYWRLPLRAALLTLLFFALALEVPGDAFAGGRVKTPWHVLGAVLFAKLNLTVPIPAMVVSGFDILVLFFVAAIVYRHATRSSLDRVGWIPPPTPIAQSMLLSLLAVAWMTAFGMARGGDFGMALWQITKHLYLPVIYLLMAYGLRGPADVPTIGRIVLGVGTFRAAEAIVLRQMFPSKDFLPHATTHHDSVLFAVCISILLAMILERPTRWTVKFSALLAPVFLLAMSANNRRLVWIEVALTAIFFLMVTPLGKAKRFFLRAAVIAILPLLFYMRLGWNTSDGSFFAASRTVRSLFDSQRDSSTRWRDWENYDLVYTFKQSPLLGSGFGHPYSDIVKLPDVTSIYPLEPYVPHNSVLGLWAFGGLFGFSLLWVVYPVGMFFTIRAYRSTRNPTERTAALGAAAAQICYLIQAYGDLGFGTWGPVFMLATSYAVVGKICVANGAWTVPVRRRAMPDIASPGTLQRSRGAPDVV